MSLFYNICYKFHFQDLSREVQKYKDELQKGKKEAKQQDVVDAVNLMQTTTTCLQKVRYHIQIVQRKALLKAYIVLAIFLLASITKLNFRRKKRTRQGTMS